MSDSESYEKETWNIGEVAKSFGVATSLIRYWENEFDILKPEKDDKGNRLYTKDDVDKLKLVYHLVKERGFTLQGAKDMIKNESLSYRDNMEAINRLKNLKSFLIELKDKMS